MTFFIQEQTTTTDGGTDTLKGLNDGLVVTLNRGSFLEINTPTITSTTSYFSPVQEYPAPTSTTGDARIAKVTASGGSNSENRVMLVRGQPMNTYWRVEIRSGGAALTGGKLFLNWGPIV